MKTKYITKANLKEKVEYRFITSEDKLSDLVLWWEWQDAGPGRGSALEKVWKVRLACGAVETLPNIVPKLFLEATV